VTQAGTSEATTPTPEKARAARIQAVDVARGSAMLLVFLSHFSIYYLREVAGWSWHSRQAWLTQGATPAFVLLSGMMLGLLRTKRGDFASMRDRLIDRGLFLLIVCRPLIAVAHIAVSDDWRLPFIDQVFITDTIGVSLIVGSLLAGRLGDRGRLRLGLAILVMSWALEVLWSPDSGTTRLVKELLFGRLLGESLLYNFPLLPWFGWYLVGSGLGAFVTRAHMEGGGRAAARVTFRFAAVAAVIVIAAKAAEFPLKLAHGGDMTTLAGRVASLLSLREKLPPGVTYLSFYGALAALGVGAVFRWGDRVGDSSRLAQAVWRWLAMIGRNSLLAFVFQFYVYYTAVHLLPKPPLWTAPFYFAFTVALLGGMIAACDRLHLNRYFRVGFARLASGRRRRNLLRGMAPPALDLPRSTPSRGQPGSGTVAERRR
jgi:uncharacterized membrane protein